MTTDATHSSLLDRLNDDAIWDAFIDRRKQILMENDDISKFERLSVNPECRRICDEIASGNHQFSIPCKKLIAKNGSLKKRTVYQFDEYEMMTLRILSSLMHSYDHLFSPNLYSFRRNKSVAAAVRRLFDTDDLCSMWGYKADVHDYFNSIDAKTLLVELKEDLNDERLYALFETILSDSRAMYNGEVIEEQKGVMAGIPISAFLANYYLSAVDHYFETQDCIYMRYADDILILSDSKDKIADFRLKLIDMIHARGLELNPKKEKFFQPGEDFEFLGFRISEDDIDISTNTVRKMKGKIRRSAKAIRRWMLKNDAPIKGTIRAFIREYNHKFYGYESGELSWSAWFLPTITTTESLHEIDGYLQDWIRYIATGRHNKKNYDAVSYELMRSCGYSPLVTQYYDMRKPIRN